MKTRILTTLGFVLFALGIFYTTNESTPSINQPLPNDGTIVRENSDEEGNQNLREEWFELMHKTAPEDNWRQIEYQNQMNRYEAKRARNRSGATTRGVEILANGNLEGEWKERGSINQAGSVFETLYDEVSNQLYVISAGGTLWKGAIDGSNWEVVNQDLRFNNGLLRFVKVGTERRMIALIGQFPHYSDDMGLTWIPSTGIITNNEWARTKWVQIMDDENQTIYVLARPDSNTGFRIYKSTDQGVTFENVVGLGNSDENRYALCKPHHSNELYLIEKINNNFTGLYKIDLVTNEVDTLHVTNDNGFGTTRANLYATLMEDGMTRFYIYNGSGEVFASQDTGATWIPKGVMPETPWAVGMFVSPTDPDFLITGGLECHRSYDGGDTWTTMNGWGAYYNDVVGKLHADMMFFNEYTNSDSITFSLISNHGGLSISYDKMASVENIGLSGLNVSQYYDVRTDPTWPYLFYAGTQDQGFQRGWSLDQDEVLEMEQVISGDYGHIAFSANGSHLWTVYPGGWITYYANPIDGGYNASWEVESTNESVWIPPLMESPNPEDNLVYLAGGAVDGGAGSYMIQLEYTIAGNSITPTQLPFDFQSNSVGGQLSAMKTAPLNPDLWYGATTNGRFFYSLDAGATWEQSLNFVPDGHYLYGQTILPSRISPNTVYYGGSGYSSPGVFKSEDNGQNFVPMTEGLPPTLVFELTSNQDESLLFAATEAGPFVYVAAEEKWYDMSGEYAPNQTYWSVEFIDEFNIVRFGTYGRGVWDFQVVNTVSTASPEQVANKLKVYPNPTNGVVTITNNEALQEETLVKVLNMSGQTLLEKAIAGNGNNLDETLDLSNLSAGTYIIQLLNGKQRKFAKVVVE